MTIVELLNGFVVPRISIVILFAVAIVALVRGAWLCFSRVSKEFTRWQHERRMKRIAGNLRMFGKMFVMNSVETGESSVTAFALVDNFRQALIGYLQAVSDDPTKKDAPRPWDKVVVVVPNTMTAVRGERNRRPAHTGTTTEFAVIFADLIERLTGEVVSDLDTDDLAHLVRVISERDPRLAVPYTSEMSSRRVFERAGQVTLDEARTMIMSVVPANTN